MTEPKCQVRLRLVRRRRSRARIRRVPKPPPDSGLFGATDWTKVTTRLRLSGREVQILMGLFDGATESGMALQLEISANTIHTHMRRLYAKLGVTNRGQAILRVVQIVLGARSAAKRAAS